MERPSRAPVWLWLNLLSLDAPLVALVWQDFLARCFPALLRPGGRVALGLTVWAIYLTDRLLDVRRPAGVSVANGNLTPRHNFYRLHKRAATAFLGAILSADLLVVCVWVRPAVLVRGLLIALFIAVYFAAFPLRRRGGVILKKLVAGLLFTAGVFLVAGVGVVHAEQFLSLAAAAFCALCTGNLLLTESWEQGAAKPCSWVWMMALCVAALGLSDLEWFRAIALSAAGLAALAFAGRRIPVTPRCVLADVVLLSPLLFPRR